VDKKLGKLLPGYQAVAIGLDQKLELQRVWISSN